MMCSNLTGGVNPYLEDWGLCITGYMFIFVGIPVLALGTVGDILTVAVLFYAKSFRKMSFGILLILQSLVDLGVLYTELLRYIVLGLSKTQLDLQGLSEAGCKAFEFFSRFFTQLSPWTLVLVTAEHFISVEFSRRVPHLCQVKYAVSAWLGTVLFVLVVNFYHPITGMDYAEGLDGRVLCRSHPDQREAYRIYPWIDLCLGSLIPGLMILAMNIVIVRRIRRSRRHRRQIARRSVKAAKLQGGGGETRMLIAKCVGILFLLLTLPATVVLTLFSNLGWSRMLL